MKIHKIGNDYQYQLNKQIISETKTVDNAGNKIYGDGETDLVEKKGDKADSGEASSKKRKKSQKEKDKEENQEIN